MNCLYIGDFRGTDHSRNIQITLRQLRRPNADGFVGKAHRERMAVSLAIDGDRADPQFLAGANDAQGYLPAVSNKDLLEHSEIRSERKSRARRAGQQISQLTSAAGRQIIPGHIRWAGR